MEQMKYTAPLKNHTDYHRKFKFLELFYAENKIKKIGDKILHIVEPEEMFIVNFVALSFRDGVVIGLKLEHQFP